MCSEAVHRLQPNLPRAANTLPQPSPTRLTCTEQRLVAGRNGQHPIDAAPPQHATAAVAADGRHALGALDDLGFKCRGRVGERLVVHGSNERVHSYTGDRHRHRCRHR